LRPIFLPSSAESAQAAEAHVGFASSDVVPGMFVIEGVGPEQFAAQAFVDQAAAAPLEGDEQGRTAGGVLASDPQVVSAADDEATPVIFDDDAPPVW